MSKSHPYIRAKSHQLMREGCCRHREAEYLHGDKRC
ncbi:hypothetical protein SNOG_14674 [Parastagonospora nodorum SN15]|uniref:Uncharacterized protein n=1 Tax=Phaeosphaeria nodorum (strain SN15 / ATCC MYA-4574 / FGSC 10173) TaxID=321614 RepID=Q0U0G4_PHANO|nr:hypothetical protein SNOG_14674 [Parastagonospora nodorum SN15]EAT77866.1 hypothetical protein SNOG_14674 [Parastagonospora nodorum SN15]